MTISNLRKELALMTIRANKLSKFGDASCYRMALALTYHNDSDATLDKNSFDRADVCIDKQR